MEHLSVWVAAFLTLGIVSFLYKDNPWYKLTEAIFVGISAGYWFVVLYWDNIYGKFWVGIFPPEATDAAGNIVTRDPNYLLIVGAFLGLLMLMRLIPNIGWIARWPLAFIIGATAGLYLINYFVSNMMLQVEGTILPILGTAEDPATFYEITGNLVIILGTFSGLVYFFFSKEHKGAFGVTAKVGVFFLMVTFGASFGYTVMSRMSLLIGRVDFLFGDWLGMIR